jgi:cytochrome b561
MTNSAARRYSTGAMIFHWLIAILVILNWQLAERAHELKGAEMAATFGYHKAFGMLILALTVGRLLWRLSHPVPPLPSGYKAWEATLARSMHVIFYVMLVGLPLGGWLASSYGGRPIDFFGLFTIPTLPVGENKDLSKAIFEAHHTGGGILLYLIALHVLGAIKHTFFDKDGGVFRMLPFGRV